MTPPEKRRLAWGVVLTAIITQLWVLLAAASFLLPPVVGASWAVAVLGLFSWRAAGCGSRRSRGRRQRARARLRPLGRAAPWIALAVPIFLTAQGCFIVLYASLVGLPPDHDGVLSAAASQRHGWMLLVANLVLVAPFVEEVCVRGWMQRPLERWLGPSRAILLTALIFAVMHFDAWGTPGRFLSGVVFGVAVRLTRSLWSGVVLHAALNGAAVSLMPLGHRWSVDLGAAGAGRRIAAACGLATSMAVLGAIALKLKSLRAMGRPGAAAVGGALPA